MYVKKLPERQEKIRLLVDLYRNKKLEIVGTFDNVGNLAKHKVETKCLECQHVWSICPDKVKSGRSCPKCARIRTGEYNRVILLKKSLDNYNLYGNYTEYKKHVRAFTSQTIKMYSLFTNVKIGKSLDLYHVDHVMSKWDCFTSKIEPYITGSLVNLQALLGLTNLQKCKQSWQSKDELKQRYSEWITVHPEYQQLIDSLPKFEFRKIP